MFTLCTPANKLKSQTAFLSHHVSGFAADVKSTTFHLGQYPPDCTLAASAHHSYLEGHFLQ